MDEALQQVINAIPKQAQRQYSTTEQLNLLYLAAVRLGLYDAADYLSFTREGTNATNLRQR